METAVGEPIIRVKRVIKPPKGRTALRLDELWEYRELLYFLTWRDIKVRYKQAILGFLWAVLNPVITVVVFDVVFNKITWVSSSTRWATFRTSSSPTRRCCRGTCSRAPSGAPA